MKIVTSDDFPRVWPPLPSPRRGLDPPVEAILWSATAVLVASAALILRKALRG
jgi:hypothetical protein